MRCSIHTSKSPSLQFKDTKHVHMFRPSTDYIPKNLIAQT